MICHCVCVACHQPLVAKKGAKRIHHFAHAVDGNCVGANESILHQLSKEILSELEYIALPAYEFSREYVVSQKTLKSEHQTLTREGNEFIADTQIEVDLGTFIPDAILQLGHQSLIVEIAVTHKVDANKLHKIKRKKMPCVEIQLDLEDARLTRQELRDKLQLDMLSKNWLYHPDQRAVELSFLRKVREEQKASHEKAKVQKKCFQDIRFATRGNIATTPNRYPTFSRNQPTLREYDSTGEEFYAQHKRYPTMSECLRLWPHLYRK